MYCPNCGRLAKYQGLGRSGDNWTGTTIARYYCPECDERMQTEVTHNEAPSTGVRHD